MVSSVVDRLATAARDVHRSPDTDLITVNHEWTVSVVLAKCHRQDSGSLRWNVRFDMDLMPDVTVAVRLNEDNAGSRDYYLVPRLDMATWPRHLGFENSPFIDGYRFDARYFVRARSSVRLREAA